MKHAVEIWRDEMIDVATHNGERKKAFEIAIGMKSEGMDVYTISRLTGLTIDEILQL